jgi:uncharacterized protein YbjQ (UPF0145 family)
MPVCKDCGTNVSFLEVVDGRCSSCHFTLKRGKTAVDSHHSHVAELPEESLARIILSTEAAPDLKVADRLDIISAEFAVGMGLLTDVFNAWRDVFGGRSKSYQNALKDARKAVLQELRREAHALGADAVLGVSLDYSEISGGGKSMLFLVASGTAVKLA